MLMKCPECELQVSEKAYLCPHCGFPLKEDSPVRRRRSTKKKRLPNGFGQITEIKGKNLRRPFRAMITVGVNESTGRPITKLLQPNAYFETYNDAYAALVEHHKNPFDLSKDLTLEELYQRWFEEHKKTLSKNTDPHNYARAWRYCERIKDMKVSDIRPRHIKGCIFETVLDGEKPPSAAMQITIKGIFNMMLDYAVEYEIVSQNYARSFNLPKDVIHGDDDKRNGHMPYEEEEMAKLWENINTLPGATEIIIQCYSGWRPRELCGLKLTDVDLDKMTFKGGSKSDAGKNRAVPIHSRIQPLVKAKYQEAEQLGSAYVFNLAGKPLTYDRFNHLLRKLKKQLALNENHRLHDGRKHFVTMAKKYKVDEYAIKYIVGHSITDLTERVYTKRDLPWLREEIEKIK